MLSIFAPLDPSDPPASGGSGFKGRNVVTGPFAPRLDDPFWKTMLSWLWLPALALFLTVVVWLQVPALAGWLLVIGFVLAYCALAWLAYRKR
jgi:hypothetical protein